MWPLPSIPNTAHRPILPINVKWCHTSAQSPAMAPCYTKIKSQRFHRGLSYLDLFSYLFSYYPFAPITLDSQQHPPPVIALDVLSIWDILILLSILFMPSLPPHLCSNIASPVMWSLTTLLQKATRAPPPLQHSQSLPLILSSYHHVTHHIFPHLFSSLPISFCIIVAIFILFTPTSQHPELCLTHN